MTNHVHLLLTPAAMGGCAQLMKHLAQLHTQYINRTYGRTGSLWEGRFQSCLVQSDEYLLRCYRYVENNPVEAGLCEHAGQYEWSSARNNAHGVFDAAITPHPEYMRLGKTAESRRAAYGELLAAALPSQLADEIRNATNGNFALGDDKFKRAVSMALGRRAYRVPPGRPSRAAVSLETESDLFEA